MSRVQALSEVVASSILSRAEQVSALLRELGVPHALIGGLAVGVHGYPRATKDVDFLVGKEAFEKTEPFPVYREELTELARVGETDIMYIPDGFPGLAEELRVEDDIPIISLPGLVLMKLSASRTRDEEDVRVLLRVHPDRIREVRDYLQQQAPELIVRLGEVLAG